MKREEELLRQALEELAQEETDELEGSLSRSEIRQAEELYRHHRKSALGLIRKNTRKAANPVYTYLRIAAAVAVVVGLVIFSLNRSQPDNIIQVQPPTSSVAPYYSPVPSDSPEPAESAAPVTPEPTVIPAEDSQGKTIPTETEKFDLKETISPTIIPNITEYQTILPTNILQAKETETAVPTSTPTLRPTDAPTIVPTEAPTEEPTPIPTAEPTETPTPTPTTEPTSTPNPVIPPDPPVPTAEPVPESASVPEGWSGSCFPFSLPAEGRAILETGDGWQRVTWRSGEREWIFTEYDRDDLLDVPENAEISYVQWDGIVALRMEDLSGVTLAWVQDGHSFSLCSSSGDAIEMARSVKKIGK